MQARKMREPVTTMRQKDDVRKKMNNNKKKAHGRGSENFNAPSSPARIEVALVQPLNAQFRHVVKIPGRVPFGI
jgi:hypothetical protein